jgi:hypothetical protein
LDSHSTSVHLRNSPQSKAMKLQMKAMSYPCTPIRIAKLPNTNTTKCINAVRSNSDSHSWLVTMDQDPWYLFKWCEIFYVYPKICTQIFIAA